MINTKNKEGDEGLLNVVFFLQPLFGVLAILFSNTYSRAMKLTTLFATITGLIASMIFS